MNYIMQEILGYMNYMSFEKAVSKVRRNHREGKEFLINQAAVAVSKMETVHP